MKNIMIDNNKSFDFGKTSEFYAKYRDIYPKELYDKLYDLGVGKSGTKWLDLGTGTGVVPRAMAHYGADITALDIAENQINEAKKLSHNIPNIKYIVSSAECAHFENNTFDTITACQCFWYFNPKLIVPEIKRIIKNKGIFVKVYMGWVKGDKIADLSQALVKKINPSWTSGAPSVADLKTHYFNNPIKDTFEADIQFTRESWHGRMLSCRGVLGSMNEESLQMFEKEHKKLMQNLPNEFTVKHKVFITAYKIEK